MRRPPFFLSLTHSIAATFAVLCLVSSAIAANETIIHDFIPAPHGAGPSNQLIADSAGNLYGVTNMGGMFGSGVAFELTLNAGGVWSQKVLHDFSGEEFGTSSDGGWPTGRLVFDSAGNLYGVTKYGGAYDCGTVYKLSPLPGGRWVETILYSFNPYANDAVTPGSGVVIDSAGNLYGTTEWGGAYTWGAVFEVSPSPNGSWTEQVLFSFRRRRQWRLPAL